LGLGVLGHPGEEVARPVDETTLAGGGGKHQLDAGDEPGAAVGDDQHRGPQSPLDHAGREAPPGVGRLGRSWLDGEQHRPAVSGHPPRDQHRLCARAGCIRKWLPSKNRYSSSTVERSRALNASNSTVMASQIL